MAFVGSCAPPEADMAIPAAITDTAKRRATGKTVLLIINSPLKFLRLSFIQAIWKKSQ
jgi:hypothetical protein